MVTPESRRETPAESASRGVAGLASRNAVDLRPQAYSVLLAILLIGGAFMLYQPALRIGLLSDDYALLMWARRLELAPRDWGQIRPIPILSWWLAAGVTSASRTPAALHALNIALHGFNALLVWALARRLTSSRWMPVIAGALFLTLPVSV